MKLFVLLLRNVNAANIKIKRHIKNLSYALLLVI